MQNPYGEAVGKAPLLGDFTTATGDMWAGFTNFVPTLLATIVVLIIGLFLARTLSVLAGKLLAKIKVDAMFQKIGLAERFEEMGWDLKPSHVMEWLIKWFFYIVTLIVVSDLLGWTQVTEFLGEIVFYIPQVFIAVIVLVVGLVAARFSQTAVEKSVAKSSQMSDAAKRNVALIPKVAIIIFAALAALTHLGIAPALIQTLFTGVIFAISLALGLAGGLGGKDRAKEVIDRLGR